MGRGDRRRDGRLARAAGGHARGRWRGRDRAAGGHEPELVFHARGQEGHVGG